MTSFETNILILIHLCRSFSETHSPAPSHPGGQPCGPRRPRPIPEQTDRQTARHHAGPPARGHDLWPVGGHSTSAHRRRLVGSQRYRESIKPGPAAVLLGGSRHFQASPSAPEPQQFVVTVVVVVFFVYNRRFGDGFTTSSSCRINAAQRK